MIIKKTAELYFTHHDIYVLETSNNAMIVNKSYEGILILNDSLNIQQEVLIAQEAPIYFLYQEYKNNGFVLYLPDAHEIALIDLKLSCKYTITLPKSFNEEILLSNYYWNNDILIFTTTRNAFYQLDFISKTLNKILPHKVQILCQDFFDFYNVCKKYNVLTLYPSQKSFIFQNHNRDLGFFNCENNKETIIANQPAEGWHDVEYRNGTFLFVYENKIEIQYDMYKNILTPRSGFIFLKGKFLDGNKFVVLSSNPSCSQESILEVYNLSPL
jgi:hypothetical protein